jgi:hypothetical protein
VANRRTAATVTALTTIPAVAIGALVLVVTS